MAILGINAYKLFKDTVGGALEWKMFGAKRVVIPEYSLLPPEVITAWDTTVESARLDGEAAYNFYKTSVEATSFEASILTVKYIGSTDPRVKFPLWVNLSARIQNAWDVVAAETA